MKHKLFKIRSTEHEEFERLQRILHNSQDYTSHIRVKSEPSAQTQITQLMTMLSTLLKNTASSQQPYIQQTIEPRDRDITIELPLASGRLTDSDLKRWVTEVMTTVSSSAFNFFSKGQMNFEQAKVYCSENFFKNLAILNKSHPLSKEAFELIDNHVKKGVIGYLNAKYPLTEGTEINKKLQQAVREVDNIEAYNNNYANNLGVDFTYREDGNYNDLIMRFINEITSLIDSQAQEEKTNYAEFQEFMSTLFEKVEDLTWMRKEKEGQANAHDERKMEDEKEKYRSKVKEYTHYLIGRKIAESTPNFSQKEIQYCNLKIKSSAVLRILTKWCEQLQEKYYDCYYSNRSESVKVQKGGNVNNLLAWMREEIDAKLAAERKEISTFLHELSQNNYQMQSLILESQDKLKGNEEIRPNEKVCGKFAYKIVRNLHAYIIAYLNKLIHGLLKVSKKFYEENHLQSSNVWPSPPSLISFKVADLMRCKFSSKEKEILRIYQEINRISRQHPEKLKIVRIKNRLKKGTNDILINIKFNNKILCEIQLAIKSGSSDFIKCSNMFHHYLYELERSVFGPLTELCSIWSSLDQRIDIFRQLVEREQFSEETQFEHTCPKLKKRFEMLPFDKPFICSQCNITYYHNNYFRDHLRCELCSYFLCANCRIDQENEEELKSTLIEREELRSQCKKRLNERDAFPISGVCILKEAKHPEVQIFTKVTYQEKDYLLGRRQGKLYQIADFATAEDKQQFCNQHLLFQFEGKDQVISQTEAIKQYILPSMIKRNFKKQKESISLMNLALNTSECRELLSLGSKNQKENVKHLFISDNKLQELPFASQEFPNLTWMSLSRNKMKNYKGIEKLGHLKQLFSIKNCLDEFPAEICQCSQLEVLTLSENNFQTINDKIAQLKSLKEFECDYTPITSIPESICECSALISLKFHSNPIHSLPANIHKLRNLEVLQLVSVNLRSLPASLGQLTKLRELHLFYNYDIAQLPPSLTNCQHLEMLNINMTSVSKICHFFQYWRELKTLHAVSTKIKEITPDIKYLQKLEQLELSNNQFSRLPIEFGELTSLRTLRLNRCRLQQLAFSFKGMRKLQLLQLQENNFGELPWDIFSECANLESINLDSCGMISLPSFCGCRMLKSLSFAQNKIKSIPNEHLDHLMNLETILASDNELVVLPRTILKMKKLNKLHVTKNKLTRLVDEQENPPIAPLENLTIAYLSANCLTSIPKILMSCSRLKELYVNQNKITIIDAGIKQLVNLEELDLDNNEIDRVPEELACLHNLIKLYLSSNRIEVIPKFLQNFKKLNTMISSDNPIRSIECVDWVLNSDIVRGTLVEVAKKIKQEQLQSMKSPLQQDPIIQPKT